MKRTHSDYDDLMCYILINQPEMFGLYSGYKLNLAKTQILTWNYLPSKNIQQKCNFNWSATKIKFLGDPLTRGIDEVY